MALATLVGVGLRAVFVGDQSLGYEEVYTASVTGHTTVTGVWHAVRATESTPPLYYLLTWLWVTLSGAHSAIALRMVSVLAGAATVPVSFMAMRRFVGNRLAGVAAWLCAISPLLVEYSIYARSYAVFVLLLTLSVWTFGALLERPSWARWIAWGAVSTACVWTHYFAGFTLVGEAVVLFAKLPRERVRLLVCSAATVVCFAPLWPLLRAQRGNSSRFAFISRASVTSRVEGVVRQFAMGTNVPVAWLEAAGILLAGGAVLAAVVGASHRRGDRVLVWLVVATGGLPLLAAVSGSGDYLLPRNIIGVGVCLAPLAAGGLTRWRGVPLAAYSAACVATVLAVQTDWRYQGSTDWAGASERVQALAKGEPIAVMPAMEIGVAGLYLHRAPLRGPTGATDIWVIVEPARSAHQRGLTAVTTPPLDLWGPGYRAVGEIDYRGFRFFHLHADAPGVIAPSAQPGGGPAGGPLAAVLAA
ncbi:MAG TPA: glycosyltransferase family 39 protein [Solirubrobacteraceae bacterium]|nr:glycosyltransferase family 39 protein [Solirubrobacteraceae bacterium]